jgi:hypothetical protein
MERIKDDIEPMGVSPKFIWLIIFFIITIFVGNFLGSFKASEFGMTYEEMSKEIWLVMLYLLFGGIAVLFLGRVKKPALRFGFRLLMVILVVAAVRNQFVISLELAPIKHEFALATNECKVTDFRELSCGKKLKDALTRRDAKLAELGAVMLNSDGWRVVAVNNTTIIPNRSGAYLFIPFK